jgi:hypothetical protein
MSTLGRLCTLILNAIYFFTQGNRVILSHNLSVKEVRHAIQIFFKKTASLHNRQHLNLDMIRK